VTFIDHMNDIMSVIGYLCVLAFLGFASVLIYTGIKQDRASKRKAAEFAAAEQRQADAWRATLKHEPVNPHALTQLLPLVETPTAPYAVVADRWPTGGGHL
jgi:threonine/homoserine/homoserine lactone efflux protein